MCVSGKRSPFGRFLVPAVLIAAAVVVYLLYTGS